MNFIAAPSPAPAKVCNTTCTERKHVRKKEKKARKKGVFLLLRLQHGKVLPQHRDKQTTCDLQMLMCEC